MERRREPRFKVGKNVQLKVLHHLAGPSLGRPIAAHVADVSGSGMRLQARVPVPCGAPVEVADGHLLLLGEVCRCGKESDGTYTVGLRIFETQVAADAEQSHFHARS